MRPYNGLILDYGGVLTSSQSDCFERFCAAEDLDVEEFTAVLGSWLDPEAAGWNPAHALERGEIPIEDFERELAGRLRRRDGRSLRAAGLVKRLLSGVRHRTPVADVARRLKEGGVRTALLSNAWSRDGYDTTGWTDLFDAVVISSEVGMRKPEAAIYHHAARSIGLRPQDCVFVDDARVNVLGAQRVGMCAIHHTSADLTRAELGGLFAVDL